MLPSRDLYLADASFHSSLAELVIKNCDIRIKTLTCVLHNAVANHWRWHAMAMASEFAVFLNDFHRLLTGMENSEKVFIAAINGVCVAGGLELLLACDLVYAADTAKIGDGHVNFGQLPGAGGSQRLPRVVGPLRAKQLIFTGELVSAVEAERIGLVNKVVPAGELDATVTALVMQFADKSRVGLKTAKRLVNIAANTDFAEGLKQEMAIVHRYATTEADATEGLVAFHEKRKPKFSR